MAGAVNPHKGSGPAISFYTWVSGRYAPFHTKVISVSEGEAAHVIDGLLYHGGNIDIALLTVFLVLRTFLSGRGELPDSSLVAMVPVSVHDRSNRPGRNQVSGMFSKLETTIDNPAERLMAIAESNSVAKQHSSAIGATLLLSITLAGYAQRRRALNKKLVQRAQSPASGSSVTQ